MKKLKMAGPITLSSQIEANWLIWKTFSSTSTVIGQCQPMKNQSRPKQHNTEFLIFIIFNHFLFNL